MAKLTSRRYILYNLYILAWTGLDWFFPPRCGGCKKPGTRWCVDCDNTTNKLPDNVCQCCGRAITTHGKCQSCREFPPTFHSIRSWAYFQGPLRVAIHELKYKGDVGLGEIFSRPLIKILDKLNWEPELVLPVPLSKKRYSERGYNQAALIARPIALARGLEYSRKALKKIRETNTQVGLNLSDRFQNVSGAFTADKRVINKKVLVIDDVFTSGATMQACSQALLDAGASCVLGLTLARSTFELENYLFTGN